MTRLLTTVGLALLSGCDLLEVCGEDVVISGTVYLDDVPVAGWNVSAQGFGGPLIRSTETDGSYLITIDSDRWPTGIGYPTVRVDPPNDLDALQVWPESGGFGPGSHRVNCGANPGLDFRFESIDPVH